MPSVNGSAFMCFIGNFMTLYEMHDSLFLIGVFFILIVLYFCVFAHFADFLQVLSDRNMVT